MSLASYRASQYRGDVLDNATRKRLRAATAALRRVTGALQQTRLVEVGR